jgi:signal transduction histidine kinase
MHVGTRATISLMAGADLRLLLEEQAALKRVAVTVATESTAERVFDVVTEEVARLVGADAANLVCFGPAPDEGVIVGKWSQPGVKIPGAGTVIRIEPGAALAEVARTGEPVRMATDDPHVPAELHERLIALGVTSLVAAPIAVSGAIWGGLVVSVTRDLTFPADVEERLGQFAGLVAVSIANAQARAELAALAEEQAALSRVAVAVATEERPDRLFGVVSEEIGRLFGADAGATVRYVEGRDEAVIVGAWQRVGEFDPPLGVPLPFQGGAIARVAQTGRTARIDVETESSDLKGHMVAAHVSSGVAAPIVVSGRLWGATSISNGSGLGRFPPGVEERLEKFTGLVAVALANAEAREQLTASRARIVHAGDAERQRLERNLHDGAQQRLVSLSLRLRIAESQLSEDPEAAAELIAEASDELALGLEELRELARGIHPAILTDHGLTPAVEALATRATFPVEVHALQPKRLSRSIEAAAFYVVSESLANVAKYASASHARVDLAQDDGVLVVEVSDDGVGGADAGGGTGLRGLSDRVEALGGRLRVSSERGCGTTVRAELPVDA